MKIRLYLYFYGQAENIKYIYFLILSNVHIIITLLNVHRKLYVYISMYMYIVNEIYNRHIRRAKIKINLSSS